MEVPKNAEMVTWEARVVQKLDPNVQTQYSAVGKSWLGEIKLFHGLTEFMGYMVSQSRCLFCQSVFSESHQHVSEGVSSCLELQLS